MTWQYGLSEDINLHVPARITASDAERQMRTSAYILRMLENQAGLILGDEVGMGKTFVALAVALSVARQDSAHRPVVVMVPPAVREKWPRDFDTFRLHCLPPQIGRNLKCGMARNAVDFLKLLDDPPERAKSVIFLTHGAMHTSMNDPWVKLAILQSCLKGKWGASEFRTRLARFAPDLLYMKWLRNYDDIFENLLSTPVSDWLSILKAYEVGSRPGESPSEADDPVPHHIIEALNDKDLTSIFNLVKQTLPLRRSNQLASRLVKLRDPLKREVSELWKDVLGNLRLQLPLLIIDEAHHLKNARTQFASLFESPEAEEDFNAATKGALAGKFERMLFLTATPFQLGHHELCSILDRFKGISWRVSSAPIGGLAKLQNEISDLHQSLDVAQRRAFDLDAAWGKLRQEDLVAAGSKYANTKEWWSHALSSEGLSQAGGNVARKFHGAKAALENAQKLLRIWVIRHVREDYLQGAFAHVPRRIRRTGRDILHDKMPVSDAPGLQVDENTILPFLLAARLVAITPESRPVFAEGLASSFEAFLHTRRAVNSREELEKVTGEEYEVSDITLIPAQDWYLQKISHYTEIEKGGSTSHPKVGATVNRAIYLWESGEKVLIFCHYIATADALRKEIALRMRMAILEKAAKVFDCETVEAEEQLRLIAGRLDKGSPAARASDIKVVELVSRYSKLIIYRDRLQAIVLRYLRRPSFMIRFLNLRNEFTTETVINAFNQRTGDLTLVDIVDGFLYFLSDRCNENECEKYIEAVESIQTGAIRTEDDEGDTNTLDANVRLIKGGMDRDNMNRLLLAFNTPFFPEILVATSVAAEGVDLHLNCRYVIHHDLAWNPSTIEQRTGRLDRIGAKAEQVGKSIDIAMPYVAATQDEKMYKVVTDRERWFNVVMGGTYELDIHNTERLAERLPLPVSAMQELRLDLEVSS